MVIKPLNDNVIVKRDPKETVSSGGIVLPHGVAGKPTRGQVVAVGPGKRKEDGERIPPDVKAGDDIVFGEYSGHAVTIGEEDFIIMRETEVYGILR